MEILPKNDGSFEKEIQKLKEIYIETKSIDGSCLDIEETLDEKTKQKLKKMKKNLATKKGQEKLKKEFCALEAKSVQLKLSGKTKEYEELKQKINFKKILFKHFKEN